MSTVLTGQETVAATGRAAAVPQAGRRRLLSRKWRRALVAYAFLLLPVGFYAVFMILPWIQTIVLSFYNWDGIGTKTGAGFSNFAHVFSDPQLRVAVVHAFELMLYFCVIPIVSALFLTALITGPRRPHWTFTRAVLFLPQVLPAVAVAVIWQWMYGENGFINQVLRWVGLGSVAQPWLASFSWAFPAVGLVGSWITLGLCLAFFIAGAQRIPIDLYEAIATDGGGRFRQFLWVTLPHLRGEIVIAATVTAISAMSAVRHRLRHDRGRSGCGLDRPGASHLPARLHVLQRRPGERAGRGALASRARRDHGCSAGRKGAAVTARLEWLGTRAVMCFALLSIVIPLLVIATTALEPPGSLNTGLSWPAHPHWGNFVSAWSVAGFSTLMRSSAIVGVAVVPVGVILATCAGYAFGTIEFPGKRLIFARPNGRSRRSVRGDRHRAVLQLEVGRPDQHLFVYNPATHRRVHALRRLLDAQPLLQHARRTDRSGPDGRCVGLDYPHQGPAAELARAAISTLAVLYFVWTWNQFLLVLIMIQDPSRETAPLGLALFVGQYTTNLPLLSAGTLIVIAPVMIVYMIFQRQFIAGLAHGAIKG